MYIIDKENKQILQKEQGFRENYWVRIIQFLRRKPDNSFSKVVACIWSSEIKYFIFAIKYDKSSTNDAQKNLKGL